MSTRAYPRVIWPRASLVLALGLGAYLVAKGALWLTQWPKIVALATHADHSIYMAQALRVREGGPLYMDWQLVGPYVAAQRPELYPPQTVYGLLVPMSYLPDVLWWAIPLGIIGSVVAHHRPSPWAWVAILACFAVPHTWTSIAAGNPVMFVAAAAAVGTVWRPAFVLVGLKPTLGLFALLGARARGWWIGVGVWVIGTLVLLPAMVDYATVIANYRGGGWFQILFNGPLVAIPVIAWASARWRDTREPDSGRLDGDRLVVGLVSALRPVGELRVTAGPDTRRAVTPRGIDH